MVLYHSRLGLENKSGRVFCVRQVYLTKCCQQIWVCVNQHFILFIHLISSETVLWGAVFIMQTSDKRLIIYTKKLLNSDWLRKECSSSVTRVQTCNTSAKLVTRVQITNGFWLAENTKETTKDQSVFSCFNNKIKENGHGLCKQWFDFVRKTTTES